jgi:cytochrome P450 family 6
VDVRETMARYTTDVIASCAFGIQSNSLKDPDAEFRRYLRKILDSSITKGLVSLLWFFAPSLTSLLRVKFLDDRTTDYLRKTVWNTVEYRSVTGVTFSLFCCMKMKGNINNSKRSH